MNRKKRIVIVGAGASGLAASIRAASEGAAVTVLEHMEESGKKLLLTGNRKCNLSNTDVSAEHYYGDGEFVSSILSGFQFELCQLFFKSLGLETEIVYNAYDGTGYLYPSSGKAEDVRDALLRKALSLGVRFEYGCKLTGIDVTDGGFVLESASESYAADALILACGSNAHPETGSDSSIYPLLKELGVGFHSFLPALVPLYSKAEELEALKGIRCDGHCRLLIDGFPEKEAYGQIQLNAHSVSGIPVLNLSSPAVRALSQGKEVRLQIRFFPTEYNIRQNAVLERRLDGQLFPQTLELPIHKSGGFRHAQSCSGGIPVDEIDPETLESRKVKGLYFAGELIGVDGECGGYNLHFAWASGMLAGSCAAQKA